MFKIGFKKYYKVLNFTTEIGKHTVGGVGTYMDELYKYHSEDTGFIHIYDENDVQTILLEDYPDTKDILAVSSSEIDQVMYLSYDIAVIHFYALSCLVSEDYIRGRKLVYVVLEAMKEKIPVIVSSNGGMAEIVGDYKYCFNPYFANDMERCIGEFQNDSIDVIEEQRARLFERSKLFTSQKMVENYKRPLKNFCFFSGLINNLYKIESIKLFFNFMDSISIDFYETIRYFYPNSFIILFKFTAHMVMAPCISMPIRPEDDAISYPCLCFSSLFFASIL